MVGGSDAPHTITIPARPSTMAGRSHDGRRPEVGPNVPGNIEIGRLYVGWWVRRMVVVVVVGGGGGYSFGEINLCISTSFGESLYNTGKLRPNHPTVNYLIPRCWGMLTF